MRITSTAFTNNQHLPPKYSYHGDNFSPPLSITDIPKNTKSLAIICHDPDAPVGDFVHWLVWNIPSDTQQITENSLPLGATQGKNDFGNNKYDGPAPPSGTHRYFFEVYALNITLDLPPGSNIFILKHAIQNHILEQTNIIALFSNN